MADLDRFLAAQDDSYDRALAEIGAGRKTSHWMWYIFPQISGLGHSPMARRYAIGSLEEACAYLAHPVLGPRYRDAVAALLALPETRSAQGVFGAVDAMKLRSSLTLFARAAPDEDLFAQALKRWFDAEEDALTLDRLRES